MSEGQLELFDVSGQQGGRHGGIGRLALELRHDQLVIATIIALIGVTVVFACGVERGKQLARAEHALLIGQRPFLQETPAPVKPQPPTASDDATPALRETPTEQKTTPPPSDTLPKAKPPAKPATNRSRYAVQVVTYSQMQLAQRELKQLQQGGEQAFLVTLNGRTVVFVGPFPTRTHASEKVATLRSRYRDCFVKSL